MSHRGAGGEAEVARFDVEPAEISLPRGASAWITVTAPRAPGFDEPISVSFVDLPAGWASEVLMRHGADGFSRGRRWRWWYV